MGKEDGNTSKNTTTINQTTPICIPNLSTEASAAFPPPTNLGTSTAAHLLPASPCPSFQIRQITGEALLSADSTRAPQRQNKLMPGVLFFSPLLSVRGCTISRRIVRMSATETRNLGISYESMAIKPPSHPTYNLKGVISLALAEDAGDRGDVTCLATIPFDMELEAHFLAKEDGIIAGIALAEMVFQEVDPSLKVEWSRKDGDYVSKGLQFGKVYGQAHSIIVAERVVLNFMQRMSGIATLTKAMADAAHPACILETRKTAPGLRLVDKWAVLIGGGRNHRMGLFDMAMIKDNHISAAGGIKNAIRSVDKYLEQRNLQMEVEVETRTLEEVNEVLHYASEMKTSLTRIMLDNMVVPLSNGDVDVSMLKKAVELINGRFETEASGNVTIETVHKIGQTGVTYISSGALTHSVKALDISLKIDTELALHVGRRTKRA